MEITDALLGTLHGEIKEIAEECKRRNIRDIDLIKERVAPLQEEFKSHPGQIFVTLTRTYDHNSRPQKNIFAGIITPETCLYPFGETKSLSSFLTGVKNACSLDLYGSYLDLFIKNDSSFGTFDITAALLLYFRDRNPEFEDSRTDPNEHLRGIPVFDSEENPRFETHIGDEKALPFLEKELRGYQYVQLSDLLGKPLPITSHVRAKIEEEQLEIYSKIVSSEAAIRAITGKIKENDALAKKDAASFDGVCIRPYVESCFTRLPEHIDEARGKLESAINAASKRRYAEYGLNIGRNIEVGTSQIFDMKVFFSDRLEKYKTLIRLNQ